MVKKTLLALIFATCLYGQAPAQQVLIVPQGTWLLCQLTPSLATSQWCKDNPEYKLGYEPSLLLVVPKYPNTIAFLYHLEFVDVNGVYRSLDGAFTRNDAGVGGGTGVASYVVLNMGLPATIKIVIQELQINGESFSDTLGLGVTITGKI